MRHRHVLLPGLFLLAAAAAIGLTHQGHADAAHVRPLAQSELEALVGALPERDCKEPGEEFNGENCQECVKTATNASKRYSQGPQGKKCLTIQHSESLHCDMTGTIDCEIDPETGGEWLLWTTNEDCLGNHQESQAANHTVDTASGTPCP